MQVPGLANLMAAEVFDRAESVSLLRQWVTALSDGDAGAIAVGRDAAASSWGTRRPGGRIPCQYQKYRPRLAVETRARRRIPAPSSPRIPHSVRTVSSIPSASSSTADLVTNPRHRGPCEWSPPYP